MKNLFAKTVFPFAILLFANVGFAIEPIRVSSSPGHFAFVQGRQVHVRETPITVFQPMSGWNGTAWTNTPPTPAVWGAAPVVDPGPFGSPYGFPIHVFLQGRLGFPGSPIPGVSRPGSGLVCPPRGGAATLGRP
ncbi:MAG: hypothetical protein AAFX06_02330 [Planctomycetota bacterium]